MAEAHSLGIVHRDIKPANLFLTSRRDGSVLLKILDFGISMAPSGGDLHLTQTWSVLGTPAYMSPEQMRSAHEVDARTDVWSLGAVLYEALEGHVPFEADSFSEMCVLVAVDHPAPMTSTPPELVPIIARCLAKAADARYANVAELARDLAALAREPERAQILVDRMVRMLDRGGRRRASAAGTPPIRLAEPPSSVVTPPVSSAPPPRLRARDRAEPRLGIASAIGVPLGPVGPMAAAMSPPPRPQTAPDIASSRPATGPISLRPRPLTNPPSGTPPARAEVEPPPSYPSAPTYQTRVPLPVPLHDDARFPRPGLQLPRGGPNLTTTRVIAGPRRGWLLAVVTAIVAIVAVIAVLAATRDSPVAPPPSVLGPTAR